MKILVLLLSLMIMETASSASAETDKVNHMIDERLKPCMNIKYSPEVIDCMMKVAEKTKSEYNNEFKGYLGSINNQEDISHNKSEIESLAKKAKQGWDLYMENECLTEASVYEKHNYSYNSTYNICLVERYSARIIYYSENRF